MSVTRNAISGNYTYSYSGADCDAYAFFPGSALLKKGLEEINEKNKLKNRQIREGVEQAIRKSGGLIRPSGYESLLQPTYDGELAPAAFFEPIKLSQMATISVSIHEAKSPVRRLGERTAHGYTRGIRTIAGTMVFLIIEDHPLRLVAAKDPANLYPELVGWSRDLETKGIGSGYGDVLFTNKISTLISPLNIMLHYQTEYIKTNNIGAGGSMMLEGVEFVNEGIVTSVNDMVTEVVCQFVAQDIRPFTDLNYENSQDIIRAYDAHRGKKLHESYYREKINQYKVKQEELDPRKFGTVGVDMDWIDWSSQ